MQWKKKGNRHCPLLQITGYRTHCLYSNMSDHNLYEPSAASITVIDIVSAGFISYTSVGSLNDVIYLKAPGVISGMKQVLNICVCVCITRIFLEKCLDLEKELKDLTNHLQTVILYSFITFSVLRYTFSEEYSQIIFQSPKE